MYLSHVKVSYFRNFDYIDIPLAKGINVFYGNNGAGKSSILEFLYYLSLAKSFRSSNHQSLIKSGHDSFSIFAVLIDSDEVKHSEGLERKYDGTIKVLFDNKNISRNSDMAKNLCVQVISPDSFDLLTEGPSVRRSFIDWGVFYSYDSYGKIFSDFLRVLKQRNSLIHNKADELSLEYWDSVFVELSDKISEFRTLYIEDFSKEILKITEKFIPEFNFKFSLNCGYKREEGLLNILKKNRNREMVFGYTIYGPHKCDLKIKANDITASQVLSRGQQKLLVISMHLAQGFLYAKKTGKNCVFLIDDVSSELDEHNQKILCDLIKSTRSSAQYFLTLLGDSRLSWYKESFPEASFFSVSDNKVVTQIS